MPSMGEERENVCGVCEWAWRGWASAIGEEKMLKYRENLMVWMRQMKWMEVK